MRYLLIILFVIFATNIYFRIKVLRLYNKMSKAGLKLRARDLIDNEKLEKEILTLYPGHQYEIKEYLKYLKVGFALTSLMFVVIVLMGILLLRNNN